MHDVGTQYRSAVVYHAPGQKALAEAIIGRLGAARLWSGPIVTEVMSAVERCVAQDHPQEYFARNPSQPYCRAVVAAKIQTFHKRFLEELERTAQRRAGLTDVKFSR